MNKEGLDIGQYNKIHTTIRKEHGRAIKCENPECKSVSPKRFEWALKRGRIYSTDINDYIQLCPSCHRKYDETDERRMKLSAAHKGKFYHGRQRIITGFKNGREFIYESIAEASRSTNILGTSIVNCLNGRAKTAGGYIWKYKN